MSAVRTAVVRELARLGGGHAGEQLRLLPLAGGGWLGAGIGVGLPSSTALGWAGLCAAVGALSLLRARALVGWALFCGGLALCLASAGVHQQTRLAGVAGELIERSATVTATVVIRGHPHRMTNDLFSGQPRWVLRVVAVEVEGRGLRGRSSTPLLVIGGQGWEQVEPGETYLLRGRLKPATRGDDVSAIITPRSEPEIVSPATGFAGFALHVRSRLRHACTGLPADAAGLLPGLVVGDTSRLSVDLEADMKATGLSHLTAVSGANITIVAGAVAFLVGRLGLRRSWRLPLAASAVVVFVVIAGPEPSVLRAAVMGVVGLLGFSLSRRSIGVPALSVSIGVLVFLDPWLSRAAGFALSVTATAGLLVLARPLSSRLSRVMPQWLALSIAVPLAAQAAVGPVTVLINPAVPLLALPANMAVEPVIAPVTVLGVIAALVALIAPSIAQIVVWPAGLLLTWVAFVAHRLAAVPGSNLPWTEGVSGAVRLALVTVVGLLGLVWLLGRGLPRLTIWRVLAVAGLVLGFLVIPRLQQRLVWPPRNWLVVACDVGQGTSVAIRSGPRSAVLIDTGPDPGLVDGCLRRLGIDTLDAIVLTHFHADHVDGLVGVLHGRTVRAVWTTSLPEPLERVQAVTDELRRAGLDSRVPNLGEWGRLGEVEYTVAGPQRATESAHGSEEGSPANNASVMMWLRTGDLSVASLGDAELDEQTDLLRSPLLGPADVVLVAHHGSAKQIPGVYEAIRPRVAVISVGADNDYGHPTPSALRLLHRLGAVVLRTDQCGDSAVTDADTRPEHLILQVACLSGR